MNNRAQEEGNTRDNSNGPKAIAGQHMFADTMYRSDNQGDDCSLEPGEYSEDERRLDSKGNVKSGQ
jgi:hypothetical protein